LSQCDDRVASISARDRNIVKVNISDIGSVVVVVQVVVVTVTVSIALWVGNDSSGKGKSEGDGLETHIESWSCLTVEWR